MRTSVLGLSLPVAAAAPSASQALDFRLDTLSEGQVVSISDTSSLSLAMTVSIPAGSTTLDTASTTRCAVTARVVSWSPKVKKVELQYGECTEVERSRIEGEEWTEESTPLSVANRTFLATHKGGKATFRGKGLDAEARKRLKEDWDNYLAPFAARTGERTISLEDGDSATVAQLLGPLTDEPGLEWTAALEGTRPCGEETCGVFELSTVVEGEVDGMAMTVHQRGELLVTTSGVPVSMDLRGPAKLYAEMQDGGDTVTVDGKGEGVTQHTLEVGE